MAIVGPTATGKSGLAHRLAQHFGDVEIVTVDSMQVYRGMDVGTAKPTSAMQHDVAYHLIDIADPQDEFSLRQFQAAARDAIADIEARGNRPLLVGGTGLYLRAIVDNLEIPGRYPELRAELEARHDPTGLYDELRRLDPVAAARMDPGNERRIVRALEVTLGSRRPFSSYGQGLDTYPVIDWDLVALDVDHAVLSERIRARYATQMNQGFLDEVRRLICNTEPISRTAAQALGYRQLAAHLAGQTTLDEAISHAEVATRRFARRQRSWFRRDPRLKWYDATAPGGLDEMAAHLVGRWHSAWK